MTDFYKRLKIGIRTKLTLTFLLLIAIVSGISLGFVSFFIEDYEVQKVSQQLSGYSKYLADYYSRFSIEDMYRKVAEDNVSIVILNSAGGYEDSINVDALRAISSNFETDFTAKLDGQLGKDGGKVVQFGIRRYIAYTQTVYTFDRHVMAYIVLLSPMTNYSYATSLYFVAILFASLLAILIATLMSKTLTTNIMRLKKRANFLANRQFDVDVPISSNDEIGELAVSIDEMANSMQEYDLNQKIFLQNASHELRTPLMSIRGYVEGIKDGVFEDTDTSYDLVLGQVDRLEKLINEVMYLSKIETADGMLKFSKTNIQEIVDESFDRVMGIAKSANIQLIKVAFYNYEIIADDDNLSTAITNILSNCLRYAKTKIVVAMKVTDKLSICISDDGPGINKEELPHVFERFYKGKKGKYGLGLAIAKAVIEAHKGCLRAYNKNTSLDNTGAVFVIDLPLN